MSILCLGFHSNFFTCDLGKIPSSGCDVVTYCVKWGEFRFVVKIRCHNPYKMLYTMPDVYSSRAVSTLSATVIVML